MLRQYAFEGKTKSGSTAYLLRRAATEAAAEKAAKKAFKSAGGEFVGRKGAQPKK